MNNSLKNKVFLKMMKVDDTAVIRLRNLHNLNESKWFAEKCSKASKRSDALMAGAFVLAFMLLSYLGWVLNNIFVTLIGGLLVCIVSYVIISFDGGKWAKALNRQTSYRKEHAGWLVHALKDAGYSIITEEDPIDELIHNNHPQLVDSTSTYHYVTSFTIDNDVIQLDTLVSYELVNHAADDNDEQRQGNIILNNILYAAEANGRHFTAEQKAIFIAGAKSLYYI